MSEGKLLPLHRVSGSVEELSDRGLVSAVADGDRAALGALYDRFHRDVYGWEGSPVHDAVAVAHVIYGTLLGTEHVGVVVDTGPELSRGRTHADLSGRSRWPRNCHVALRIDAERFFDLLLGRLASL